MSWVRIPSPAFIVALSIWRRCFGRSCFGSLYRIAANSPISPLIPYRSPPIPYRRTHVVGRLMLWVGSACGSGDRTRPNLSDSERRFSSGAGSRQVLATSQGARRRLFPTPRALSSCPDRPPRVHGSPRKLRGWRTALLHVGRRRFPVARSSGSRTVLTYCSLRNWSIGQTPGSNTNTIGPPPKPRRADRVCTVIEATN